MIVAGRRRRREESRTDCRSRTRFSSLSLTSFGRRVKSLTSHLHISKPFTKNDQSKEEEEESGGETNRRDFSNTRIGGEIRG